MVMRKIVAVRLHGQGMVKYADASDFNIEKGQGLVLETSQGLEYGICSGLPREVGSDFISEEELLPIVRLASEEDEKAYARNLRDEKEALLVCREQITKHELDMCLVGVEYTLDRSRLTFYFTADGRIDFRELVKDLATIFRTRIELRQIGVRDEACIKGGLGVCGRELCCASFMREFYPVSIRMAKEQNLSMNPNKISGACGRLLCCLHYEEEAYKDARKRLPAKGAFVRTPAGRGTVQEVDILRERVKVRLEGEIENLLVVHVSELDLIKKEKRQGQDEG